MRRLGHSRESPKEEEERAGTGMQDLVKEKMNM